MGAVDLSELTTRVASIDEIPARTLYEILRLRVDVFVVEQDCAFPDLDGRDVEPDARHLWIEDGDDVVGYARLLAEPEGGSTIGRVVTPIVHRGTGLGAHLMRESIARVAYPIRLKAQQRLAGWYEQFGFEVTGAAFDEDGIAHVPMRLDEPPSPP
jgi:ElaA protein